VDAKLALASFLFFRFLLRIRSGRSMTALRRHRVAAVLMFPPNFSLELVPVTSHTIARLFLHPLSCGSFRRVERP
jgi:hypothetical protein